MALYDPAERLVFKARGCVHFVENCYDYRGDCIYSAFNTLCFFSNIRGITEAGRKIQI